MEWHSASLGWARRAYMHIYDAAWFGSAEKFQYYWIIMYAESETKREQESGREEFIFMKITILLHSLFSYLSSSLLLLLLLLSSSLIFFSVLFAVIAIPFINVIHSFLLFTIRSVVKRNKNDTTQEQPGKIWIDEFATLKITITEQNTEWIRKMFALIPIFLRTDPHACDPKPRSERYWRKCKHFCVWAHASDWTAKTHNSCMDACVLYKVHHSIF